MQMYFTVYDGRRSLRGNVRLRLDWGRKSWTLEEDQNLAWLRLAYSKQGAFEVRDNRVLWFWDGDGPASKHNTIIVHNPPTSPADLNHSAGRARIFDPKDPLFKEGQIEWSTCKQSMKSSLPPIRRAILDLLAANLPAFPAEPKEPPNIVAETAGSSYAGVTNCGTLPGWVVRNLHGAAGLVPDKMKVSWTMKDKEGHDVTKTDYAVVTSPMTAWEEFSKYVEHRMKVSKHLWIPYEQGGKLPKPGDIYVLGKTAGPSAKFAHVGVMIDSRGTNWRTADAGQGGGFAVGYRTRVWDPKTGTLTLILGGGQKLPPDLGTRYLKGWVDVENLFQGWRDR